eukprot:Hpha_TRINITY_DN17092_c0_g1::TRINITY_DN17092_c0_g1_i1::g.166918::m.166918
MSGEEKKAAPPPAGEAPAEEAAVQELIRSERVGSLRVRLSRRLSPNRITRERSALHRGGEGRVSLLQLAAYTERVGSVRALLDTRGCDPNLWEGTSYPSPLQCACMYKERVQQVQPTKEEGGKKRGSTTGGVSFGSVAVAELLLRRGANVNEASECGVNAVALAIMNNNAPLTNLLLRYGADPTANTRLNLLHIAANRGLEIWEMVAGAVDWSGCALKGEAMRAAARQHVVEPTARDFCRTDAGSNMLHILCVASAHNPVNCLASTCDDRSVDELALELTERLLDLGASIATQDVLGRTPLHLAWGASTSPRLCALLLRYGASCDVRDLTGNRPFETHPSGRSALHICLSGEDNLVPQERREWCELLLDNRACDLTARAPQCKSTVLHALCRNAQRTAGAPSIAERLIEAGAPVDAQDAAQETPLYAACVVSRSPALVAKLLSHGADPDVGCRGQRTALQVLVRGQPFEGVGIIACLLCRHSRFMPHETPISPSGTARVTQAPAVSTPLWHPFLLRAQEQVRELAEAQSGGPGSAASDAAIVRLPRRGGVEAVKARRAREKIHFEAYLRGDAALPTVPLFNALEVERADEDADAVGDARASPGAGEGAPAGDALEEAARAAAVRRWLEIDTELSAQLEQTEPLETRAGHPDRDLQQAPSGSVVSKGVSRLQLTRPRTAAAPGSVIDGGFARIAKASPARETRGSPQRAVLAHNPSRMSPKGGVPSVAEYEEEVHNWRSGSFQEQLNHAADGSSVAASDAMSDRLSQRPGSAPARPATTPATGPQTPVTGPHKPPGVRPPVAARAQCWQDFPVTARDNYGPGGDVVTRLLRSREQDARRKAREAAGMERRQEARGKRHNTSELLAARRELLLDMITHSSRSEAARLEADRLAQRKRRDDRRAELCRRRLGALTAVEAGDGNGWLADLSYDAPRSDMDDIRTIPPRKTRPPVLVPAQLSPYRNEPKALIAYS